MFLHLQLRSKLKYSLTIRSEVQLLLRNQDGTYEQYYRPRSVLLSIDGKVK